MNLPELTISEKSLLWDQGFVDLDHPKADLLLSVAEALKSSGYDLATVLDIIKRIQEFAYLPSYFSIVNNTFLVFPKAEDEQYIYSLLDCEYIDSPGERKLMALTFWM